MAKKMPVPRKAGEDPSQQFVDAIITVKHVQEFVKEHGGLAQAQEAVNRVQKLVELTGNFRQLKQVLEIVGAEAESTTSEGVAPYVPTEQPT